MKISTSSEAGTRLVAFTITEDDGAPVASRVVSVEVAERVGHLFLDVAAAARSRGQQTAALDLDTIIDTAEGP